MQGAAWSKECLHLKLNFQLYIQIAWAHRIQEEENIPISSPSTQNMDCFAIDIL